MSFVNACLIYGMVFGMLVSAVSTSVGGKE